MLIDYQKVDRSFFELVLSTGRLVSQYAPDGRPKSKRCNTLLLQAEVAKMTEKFSVSRCYKCGARVGLEDGIRQDPCECGPLCESCGRRFVRGFSKLVCDDCIEEEVMKEFSEAFLKSLSAKQMSLLFKEFARRFE